MTAYWGLPKNSFGVNYGLEVNKLYDHLISFLPGLIDYFEPTLPKSSISQKKLQTKFRNKYKYTTRSEHDVSKKHEQADLPVANFYKKIQKDVIDVVNETNCMIVSIEEIRQKFDQFLALENEGMEVVASIKQTVVNMNNLTANGLANFYKEITELIPHLNICVFMARGIELSIKANHFQVGLLRLQAMEDFYIRYPNYFPAGFEGSFKCYQAIGYALCSNYDRLSELYKCEIQRKLAHKKN